MRTVLVEASPRNASTGATVSVALAGGGRKGYSHRGRNDWLAGIAELPTFSALIEWGQEGLTGGSRPEFGQIRFKPSKKGALAELASRLWNGAPIEVREDDDDLPNPTWPITISGRVSDHSIVDGELFLTVRDNSEDLDKPLLEGRFDGSGGIEGDSFAEGRIKRRSFGAVSNVECRALIQSSLVFECGDPSFRLNAITDVKDIGRSASSLTVVAWQGSIAATLAALEAANAPQGGGVVAPSIACVKWWTQPVGPLTADIEGEIGLSYVETMAEISQRVIATRSSITVSNVSAMATAKPGRAGIHVEQVGETIAQVLDRLLVGSNIVWTANAAGEITLNDLFASPVEMLDIVDASRRRSFKPTTKRVLGYRRNHRIHSDGEISAALRDPDGNTLLGEVDLGSSKVTGELPTERAVVDLRNSNVSISEGGALTGAGGGQVTINGLGYTGDLNATFGALDGEVALIDSRSRTFVSESEPIAGAYGLGGVGDPESLSLDFTIPFGPQDIWAQPSSRSVNVLLNGSWTNEIATIGADAGANLRDSVGALLGDSDVRNSALSMGANGALVGGGGGQVTITGLGYTGALNATFGGDWASNLSNIPSNLSGLTGSEAINNSSISIGSNGAIAGAGGGQVTLPGLGFTGDANANFSSGALADLNNIDLSFVTDAGVFAGFNSLALGNAALTSGLLPSSRAASDLNNSSVSISASGALSGAGGGQVTIGGLGYTGALDATRGALPVELTRISAASRSFVSEQEPVPGSYSIGSSDDTESLALDFTIPFGLNDTWSRPSEGRVYSLSGGFFGTEIATIGATAGTDLRDSLGGSLGDSDVRNSTLSMGSNGALSGGGGGQVTIVGLGYTGDLNATRNTGALADLNLVNLSNTSLTSGLLPTSRAATGLVNSSISMGSNGALSGAGGGQVTLLGLGAGSLASANVVTAALLDGSVIQEVQFGSASNVTATDAGAVLVQVDDITAKPSQGGKVVLLITADCEATTSSGKAYHIAFAVLQRRPSSGGSWVQVGTSWRMFYLGAITTFTGYSGEQSDGAGGVKVPVTGGFAEMGFKELSRISNHTVGTAAANQWVDTPPSDGDYDYRVLLVSSGVPGQQTLPEVGAATAKTAEVQAISVKVTT